MCLLALCSKYSKPVWGKSETNLQLTKYCPKETVNCLDQYYPFAWDLKLNSDHVPNFERPVHYLLSHPSYWKIFSMFAQKENKTHTALGSKPNLNTTHSPQQAGKVLHQGLATTNRHWCLQTRFCHKSHYADSLGYAQLFVCCRYISLLVVLHSSWKRSSQWIRSIFKETREM